MIKGNVTAEEVRRAIASRISAGMYPSGTQLPPTREMAQELGANRNTVNKAYRALEQIGLLQPKPGRKAFIVGAAPQANANGAVEHWRRQAHDLVWQAMATGLPRRQVLDDLSSLVSKVYGSRQFKVKFLECNLHDSTALGAELARLADTPVEAGLLDQLDVDTGLGHSYDLIVTTFHHLAEVDRIFKHFPDKVIGVDTRLSVDVLHELARLSSAHIGVICGVENTARKLSHIISGYHPGSVVESALLDDQGAVRRLVAACDKLVVTHSSIDQLAAMTNRRPDVLVEFRIDEQSITMLTERIHEARRQQLALHQTTLGGEQGRVD